MKKNDILLIAISACVLVAAWIGFTIYHNLVTSTVSSNVGDQLISIAATFDMKTIDALKNRKKIIPNLGAVQPATPSATPTISPTPVASPSAIITPTKIATSSSQAATGGATAR